MDHHRPGVAPGGNTEVSRPPNKVMLITGSGSGIGAAIARELAGPGASFVLHANTNRSGCKDVARELEKCGSESVIVLGNLADFSTAGRLVHAAEQNGGLDVLVAAAGFPVIGKFGEIDRSRYEYAHAAIAGGFFELATLSAPLLRRSAMGRVVSISTHNAHVFRTDYASYPASAAAKAALEALTRALALQLAPDGITVNCVVPGLIKKPKGGSILTADQRANYKRIIPFGRFGTPEEVAAVVAFLVSARASYITGQVIHVNGGLI